MLERPKRGCIYPEIWRYQQQPDPQAKRVYAWQREVLGALRQEDWLGAAADHSVTKATARAGGLAYLNHLWSAHARTFLPYFTAPPHLRLGFRGRGGANACAGTHTIYCNLESLRRVTLAHEVCHLFTWRDGGHGPQFCAALVYLWACEFGVDRARALTLAAHMGVEVAA
jgi:hypothetical protein